MRAAPTEGGTPTSGSLAMNGTANIFDFDAIGISAHSGCTVNNYTADAEL